MRESGTVAIPRKLGFSRREVGSSYKLSMTSPGSCLVHHLYFSSRHLQPVSERSSKDSQACTSAAFGRDQRPRAQRQSSHTSSSCAWSNKSVSVSLWSHSFSHSLFTVCLYTTIYTTYLHHHVCACSIPDSLHRHRTGEDGVSGPPPSSWEPGPNAPGLTPYPLPSGLQTLPQPAVQGQELSQEAPVGDDASVVLDFLDGLHEGEVVVQHEVGQYQRGRSAHSHGAVYQDLPCEDRHTRWLWDCLWWAGGG